MEIIVSDFSASTTQELQKIAETVSAHFAALRDEKSGKQLNFSGLKFNFLQSGGNVVYRVFGERLWYLKMPKNNGTDGLEGEIRGYRFVNEIWRDSLAYLPPAAIGVSLDPPFILSANIPGEQLNTVVYRGCWSPIGQAMGIAGTAMANMGELLAVFHREGQHVDAPPVSRTFEERLARRLEKVTRPDTLTRQISGWLAALPPVDAGETLVHGNCTFRNIVVFNEQVHLLDYETCRRDTRYNDLARMCSDIILTRSARLFPWRRAYHLLGAFLENYHKNYPLDVALLTRYIGLYLFDRYVQVYQVKKGSESIAGLPVSGKRQAHLYRMIFENNTSELFTSIQL